MNKRTLSGLAILVAVLLGGCGEEEDLSPCVGDEVEMVAIKAEARGFNFLIDKYEVSRTDAAASAQGSASKKACSVPNVAPWSNATLSDARSACRSVGKRLCTAEEWFEACQSAGKEDTYPYGKAYAEGSCNDSSVEVEGTVATGSLATCETTQGVFDMVGNVREWVEADDLDQSILAGGGFNSERLDAACASKIAPVGGAQAYSPGNGDGFRCCKDGPTE